MPSTGSAISRFSQAHPAEAVTLEQLLSLHLPAAISAASEQWDTEASIRQLWSLYVRGSSPDRKIGVSFLNDDQKKVLLSALDFFQQEVSTQTLAGITGDSQADNRFRKDAVRFSLHAGGLLQPRAFRLPENPPAEVIAQAAAAARPVMTRLFVYNRGDAAVRSLRAAEELSAELGYQIDTLVIYGDEDKNSEYVRLARRAIHVSEIFGPSESTAKDAFVNPEKARKIIEFGQAHGFPISHVDPGWGFQSEKADFAALLEHMGVQLVGPPSSAIRDIGSKTGGKGIAQQSGVPTAPGSGDIPISPAGEPDMAYARREASRVGFPLIIKASEGGGGKGMVVVQSMPELEAGVRSAVQNAIKNFSSNKVAMEAFLTEPAHLEFQVIADGTGNPDGVQVVGYRLCSVQRRYQKFFEWSGPDIIDSQMEAEISASLKRFAASQRYLGAGTFEFLLVKNPDGSHRVVFMEMNTRLQVEHTVTEERYGVDLKKQTYRLAMGQGYSADFLKKVATKGDKFVLNFRLQAEDTEAYSIQKNPETGREEVNLLFTPSSGRIEFLRLPQGPHVRVDSGVAEGSDVSNLYDNMIAKITVTGNTWEEVLANMERALKEVKVVGVKTNVELGLEVLRMEQMKSQGGIDFTVPSMGNYLVAKVATQLGRPELIENALQRGYVDKYKEVWAQGKPLRDEALIAAAVSAYKMSRATVEESLLMSDSRVRVTKDTLPPAEGLSFELEVEGQMASVHVRELALGKVAVTINGRTAFVDAQRVNYYQYLIKLMGEKDGGYRKNFDAVVGAVGGRFEVTIDGVTHNFKLSTGAVGKDKGVLTAPTNANVWRLMRLNPATGKFDIPLRVGDVVKKGDELLNLEAMKMEMAIVAPFDGVVEAIYVDQNGVTQPGLPLVKIKASAQEVIVTVEQKSLTFMEGYEMGPRATIGFVPDEDGAALQQVSDRLISRLHDDAPRLTNYIGEYLRGFDYNQTHIKRLLAVLSHVENGAITPDLKASLLHVLSDYAERQTLFSEEYRHDFQHYLRNYKNANYEVPRKLRPVLIANFKHFGIVFGEKEAIKPSEKYPAHVLANAIMRMRQSWTNGAFRRQVVAQLIEIAGRLGIQEAIPTLKQIYKHATDRGAAAISQAIIEAAKGLNHGFFDELIQPLIPVQYRDRYDAMRLNVLSGFASYAARRMAVTLSSNSRSIRMDDPELEPTIKKLAVANGAKVWKLYSPNRAVKMYWLQWEQREGTGSKTFNQLVALATNANPIALKIQSGKTVGEANLEKLIVAADELIGAYTQMAENKNPKVAFTKNRVIVQQAPEIVFDETGSTNGVLNPNALAKIGSNIFAFATLPSMRIESTTVLVTYQDEAVKRNMAFQFLASSSAELLIRRTTQDEYFKKVNPDDAKQHARGKLTVEERAARFFDHSQYEVIRVKGVDKPLKRDGVELPNQYEPNGVVIARGQVQGREVIAVFGDFRLLGGAAGDVEGRKMAAANILSYLQGLPIVWFNDSAGAKIPEGIVSLNRAAEDFGVKAVTGGMSSPETFVRWVENHPDQAFMSSVVKQFGNGRPLAEQVRQLKRQPVSMALMVGGNAGMIVYGPSELAHIYMVDAEEFFGLLTGRDVVYQVTSQRYTNYQLGGAATLVKKAGTVDERVKTEDEVIELARRTLDWFDPQVDFGFKNIQRASVVSSEDEDDVGAGSGNVVTLSMLARHVDGGILWGYKEELNNSGGLLTSWARLAGKTVGIMGERKASGFGSKEAIKKGYNFVLAATQENVPLIRIIGKHWYDVVSDHDGDIIAARMDLSKELARSRVPQIAILTEAEALHSTPGTLGSDALIFIKHSNTSESDLYVAKRLGCVVVDSFEEAMNQAALFVRLMSLNNKALPQATTHPEVEKTEALAKIIPQDLKQIYDMHDVIRVLADDGEFFELGSDTESSPSNQDGSNLVTAFISMGGRLVGVVADQPGIRAGAPDFRGAAKYRRFVELCEARRIPILAINDAPGFEPGPDQEGNDIQGEGGKSLRTNILSTVPVVSLNLRKAFGGRFIHAFHRYLRPGVVVLATHQSQIAVMGERGGIPFTFKTEYKKWVIDFDKASTGFIQLLAQMETKSKLVSDFLRDYNRLEPTYPTMRMDALKRFLGTPGLELPENLAAAIQDVKKQLADYEALTERYRNEVANPIKATETQVVDRVVKLTNLKADVLGALHEAELLTALAFDRPYSVLTSHEAMLSFALHRLHDLGIAEGHAVALDKSDSSQDRIVVGQLATQFEPVRLLQILAEPGLAVTADERALVALLHAESPEELARQKALQLLLAHPDMLPDVLAGVLELLGAEAAAALQPALAMIVGAAHVAPVPVESILHSPVPDFNVYTFARGIRFEQISDGPIFRDPSTNEHYFFKLEAQEEELVFKCQRLFSGAKEYEARHEWSLHVTSNQVLGARVVYSDVVEADGQLVEHSPPVSPRRETAARGPATSSSVRGETDAVQAATDQPTVVPTGEGTSGEGSGAPTAFISGGQTLAVLGTSIVQVSVNTLSPTDFLVQTVGALAVQAQPTPALTADADNDDDISVPGSWVTRLVETQEYIAQLPSTEARDQLLLEIHNILRSKLLQARFLTWVSSQEPGYAFNAPGIAAALSARIQVALPVQSMPVTKKGSVVKGVPSITPFPLQTGAKPVVQPPVMTPH